MDRTAYFAKTGSVSTDRASPRRGPIADSARHCLIALQMQDSVDHYCSFSKLQLGIFTFNIDGVAPRDFEAATPVNQTLLHTFLNTLDSPDLISFNFQELIDLSDLTLAARTFLFATKHHDVTLRYKHWLAILSDAVLQRLGPGYELVKEEKLVGVSSVLDLPGSPCHERHRSL